MTTDFIQMSEVLAELMLMMIRDIVKFRMENAKTKGKRIGKPKVTKEDIPDIFYKHYPSYINKNLNLSEFSRVTNLSRNTIYKYIKILLNN